MAFIRPKEIQDYVIPWLREVQAQSEKAATPRREVDDARPPKKMKRAHDLVKPDGTIPMDIPVALEDKIHLYNAMLQLGLPKFVQLPLIDKIMIWISLAKKRQKKRRVLLLNREKNHQHQH
ncbi:hypothetical protein J4E93_007996 [Alternaria ventricosa]|uniref:uncharacterized protein n=1 Tax=Alternaria ventricosa TaxID=1187951 RepID=UPI0020C31167|nr:uncharacterized protein J4E93_007996 [Alternaria ventricosa]KAI4641118.1 hypothetical protein J4E93_007996 [Alternaria ventricosa]